MQATCGASPSAMALSPPTLRLAPVTCGVLGDIKNLPC